MSNRFERRRYESLNTARRILARARAGHWDHADEDTRWSVYRSVSRLASTWAAPYGPIEGIAQTLYLLLLEGRDD